MHLLIDRKRVGALALIVTLMLAFIVSSGEDAFAKKKKKKKGPAAIPATSFYFHGGVPPVNLGGHTFDTTAPTAQGAIAPGSQGVGQTPHPVWTGEVPAGQATTIVVDFWQKAPVDEVAFSEANYNITIGGFAFPLIAAPVTSTDVPSHIVLTFEAGFPGAPLPMEFPGGEVEIEIAGNFTDGEAVTVILYDTAQFPSGFAINPAA